MNESYTRSFYRFGKGQTVTLADNSHGIAPGTTGKVIGRRASETGLPEYLIKIKGRGNPVSVAETEVV